MRDVVGFHRLKSSGHACCNGTSRATQFIVPGKLDLMIYYVAAGGWNQGSGQGMIRRKSAVSTLSFGDRGQGGEGLLWRCLPVDGANDWVQASGRRAQKSAEQLLIDTGAGWCLLNSDTSLVHNLLGE
ncbi:hypothetical protein CGLO_14973 [Colletotrichum gloeosporioides Cg-14]|uniref:Uncharacterized protein n=1 Tax=Colletotrichum gloeosporioides (strain Cg-14) TaxID=1237896 RepID=T0LCJ8_COLGC|nr:hypothetical protein CGLO_14973 [Colletotrichum gloeosporioides Cg-14]